MIAMQTLSHELRTMGYRLLSAHPRHHAHADVAIADLEENYPAHLAEIGRSKRIDPASIEIWFADEARVGRKHKITRRWAWRSSCPIAPKDHCTAFACILGAICPKLGKAAGLVMPCCNTEVITLHLAEISRQVKPHAHAVLLVDQAG